jgi:hypothetical protein
VKKRVLEPPTWVRIRRREEKRREEKRREEKRREEKRERRGGKGKEEKSVGTSHIGKDS